MNLKKQRVMEKYFYEQPEFEVVEIEVEKGFSLSDEQQESSPWEDL
jgi:hypothetical protein